MGQGKPYPPSRRDAQREQKLGADKRGKETKDNSPSQGWGFTRFLALPKDTGGTRRTMRGPKDHEEGPKVHGGT